MKRVEPIPLMAMKIRSSPLLLLLFTACHGKEVVAPLQTTLFETTPTKNEVTSQLREASGIADSKTVPHTLWVEEDSGNPPQLLSLNYDVTLRKKVYIKIATNTYRE